MGTGTKQRPSGECNAVKLKLKLKKKTKKTTKILDNRTIADIYIYLNNVVSIDAVGMTNSVYPDQTSPFLGPALFSQTCLSECGSWR